MSTTPVSVTEILGAKLLMVLVVTALAGLPYLAVVFALLITLGIADAAVVPALLAPFVAAVICSVVARIDRRAPRRGRWTGAHVVLSLVLLIIAVAAVVVAMRWITFERYLE